MKKYNLFVVFAFIVTGCQSIENNASTEPEAIAQVAAEKTEPRIIGLPGIAACDTIIKSNIETIYTGRWLEKDGQEAQPHTLVVMKPTSDSQVVYYASSIWKPWGFKSPSCKRLNAVRDGNSISLLNEFRDGKASARYELNGEKATGEFENNGKTWPTNMNRYWVAIK